MNKKITTRETQDAEAFIGGFYGLMEDQTKKLGAELLHHKELLLMERLLEIQPSFDLVRDGHMLSMEVTEGVETIFLNFSKASRQVVIKFFPVETFQIASGHDIVINANLKYE